MKAFARPLSALALCGLLLCIALLAACDPKTEEPLTTDVTDVTDDVADTSAPEEDYVDARPSVELITDAAELDALILSIDAATVENGDKIDLAYLSYCALSAEEKEKVLYLPALDHLRRSLTKEYVVKEYLDSRMPHNELLIGAYVCQNVPAKTLTDYHFQAMVDCNIDFAWQVGKQALDWYDKYGIGVFEWTGLLGMPVDFNMSEEQFRAYTTGVDWDHPALWTVYATDEPLCTSFRGCPPCQTF